MGSGDRGGQGGGFQRVSKRKDKKEKQKRMRGQRHGWELKHQCLEAGARTPVGMGQGKSNKKMADGCHFMGEKTEFWLHGSG